MEINKLIEMTENVFFLKSKKKTEIAKRQLWEYITTHSGKCKETDFTEYRSYFTIYPLPYMDFVNDTITVLDSKIIYDNTDYFSFNECIEYIRNKVKI
jgi:arginine deiminase